MDENSVGVFDRIRGGAGRSARCDAHADQYSTERGSAGQECVHVLEVASKDGNQRRVIPAVCHGRVSETKGPPSHAR